MRLRSSAHSVRPYDFEISICLSSNSEIDTASVVSDLRPDPPTPMSSALPYGCWMMRDTRDTCSMALSKSTSDMGLLVIALYSSRKNSIARCISSRLATSVYLRFSGGALVSM